MNVCFFVEMHLEIKKDVVGGALIDRESSKLGSGLSSHLIVLWLKQVKFPELWSSKKDGGGIGCSLMAILSLQSLMDKPEFPPRQYSLWAAFCHAFYKVKYIFQF